MSPTQIIQHLNSIKLPESVKLSEWENVIDVRRFVSTSIQLLEQAGPRAEQTPAWERLRRLYSVLTQGG